MRTKIGSLINCRYGGIIVFSIIFLSLSFIVRTALLIKDFGNLDLTVLRFIQVYLYGLFYDMIAISYFTIPFVLYLLIIPNKLYQSRIHTNITAIFFVFTIGILVFSGIGEWFFWDEFNVRFNFIAVDYLVYTHEVVSNIRESYPMLLIIVGIILVSAGIFLLVRKKMVDTINLKVKFLPRLKISILLLSIPLMSFFSIDETTAEIKGNLYCNELAHNGIYQIFAAFRNNELDYKTFYKTIDDKEAFQRLRSLIKTPNSEFLSQDVYDIRRKITYPGDDKHYNIMMITVESLSASFFKRFGNKDNITPKLDSISKESMLFTNFYATGTRTVRGMEALTLSLPPTPGYSIVKRPNNENMFSMGNILKEKGYSTNFIYAGYGYFDNMNYFFYNNGYNVVDRHYFKDEEISFENAWGVCDEDLFTKAIQVADSAYKHGKPFHNFIMTTSNHRPYTYPEGKVDIPSHTGRSGAVKYTDFSIGEFLKKARSHEWYSNTIFVIVADHCASSAGKTSLPVRKYHIPLIIYAPDIIKPVEIDALASQIDFAPTILGLLNMDYTSKFFGKDILYSTPNRALIGTYQKIGYLKESRLTVQLPVKRTESYSIESGKQENSAINNDDLQDAISYYQTASYLFKNKGYLFKE